MRVLVCGRGAADPRSMVWTHVMGSLRHLGHEVLGVDPTSPGRSGLCRGGAVESITAVLDRYEPHLMVHIPSPGDLTGREVRRMTAASQTVSIALHMSTTMGEATTRPADAEEHLLDYDLVCVADQWAYERLVSAGGYRVSCLEPAVHSVMLDQAVESTRAGVVVVGEPDDRSAAIVRSLVDRGVEVRMYGVGWSLIPDLEPRSFPRVGYPEMATVLAGAELVLELPIGTPVQSFARLSSWEAPLGQCVLDAAAVATPSLTLERAGVAALMNPGIDVATYATDEDLKTLVPLLLADEEGLRAMGECASDTVRSRHLWIQRWDHLLSPFDCQDDDGEAVLVKPSTGSTKVSVSA